MKCPVDDVTLVMSERSGVEIDYCPTCRGVWLDRGELDKILDRMAGGPPSPAPSSPAPPAPAPTSAAPAAPPLLPPPLLNENGRPVSGSSGYDTGGPGQQENYRGGYRRGSDDRDRYENRRDDYSQQGKYGSRRPKKKKDWLSDIFDF